MRDIIQMSSKQSHEIIDAWEWSSLLSSVKEYLFLNNFSLASSLRISLPLASFFLAIEELQKFAIVSRLASNPTIGLSSQMAQVDAVSRYLLLDVTDFGGLGRQLLLILLMLAQLLVTICYLVPFKEESIRKIISKVVVSVQLVLTIPSIIVSIESLSHQQRMGESGVLLFFTVINSLIYNSMGLQCSFERENDNVLVRVPYPLAPQLLQLLIFGLFPLLTELMYPTSFLIVVMLNLGLIVWQWGLYLRSFIYFQEGLARLKGVLLSINISSHLCYLSIQFLSNAIIENNVLIFISAFSIFLGNFFLVYRNYIVKTTIINQEIRNEHEIAIFGVFYWHCYVKFAEKKNELYLSSLLKKHTNQCQDVNCCCKHRQLLYDANLKTYGNPAIQPHFDRIFIRHYIRKILNQGYEEHSKSSTLAFLLATFDIESLEMITQTMELIHKLVKMEQKKQLSFMEQYLLYCLRKKTRVKVLTINSKRGNLDLQSVKIFDERIITLQVQLKDSVHLYNLLWKNLSQTKLNEGKLYKICKEALQLMFSMQKIYNELKNINNESTELKTIMTFYSRMVLHDIHLLSEIKKEIKSSHERNLLIATLDLSSLRLFGNSTASLIAQENGKIKWTSKNIHTIFQYQREEFQGLNINNLMPQYFAENHDRYIEKWKETGHHIKLNKVSYIWGSTKEGYCFSMLMFAKIILLPHEQDYAFFACLEKIDDQFEVICSPMGEVYGAGKLFNNALGLKPHFLQQTRPNIQIFLPYAFQYFLQYFFPDNPKLKTIRKTDQIRREGYFPDGLENLMKQLSGDRQIFARNHKGQENYEREYLNFVRTKMQELTCSVNGEYISFMVDLNKKVEMKRQKCEMLSFKFSNPKKDNIERYYNDLEKMIRKLQELTDEETSKKTKTANKKNRSDFFRAFLNPKRVKRLLQEEKKEQQKEPTEKDLESKTDNLKSDSCFKSDSMGGTRTRKPTSVLVAHRKQLALGAQVEIKNERVRYNLWKIKNMLLEEGIISRYTYNLLIGKQGDVYNFESLAQVEQAEQPKQQTTFKIPVRGYDEHVSEDDRESVDNESGDQLGEKEDNDNQTFNSASSSATFISMTSQVKIFKYKLRSLNSPRPLLLLQIVVILALVMGIVGLIYELMSNLQNCSNGLKQFNNNREGNQILSMLIEGQFNIENLNANLSNPFYMTKKTYLQTRASGMFKRQLLRRMQDKKIDPSILSYLSIIIVDHHTPFEVKEFFTAVIDQMIKNQFSHRLKYFTQTLNSLEQYDSTNIFFEKISGQLLIMTLTYLAGALLLFLVTLPVVGKVKTKIKDIYGLLSKISPNEKSKYNKHFVQLFQEFKKNPNINHENFGHLLSAMEATNAKNFKTEQMSVSEDEKKQNISKAESEGKEEEASISNNRKVYINIVAAYSILLAGILFYFIFIRHYNQTLWQAYYTFTNAFNRKSENTFNFIECNYEMMNYAHETECYSPKMPFVDAIYQTYHLPSASDEYKAEVFKFSTGQACDALLAKDEFNIFTPEDVNLCKRVIGGSLNNGAFNTMYYVQRKMEERLTQYYVARNYTPNDQSNLHYPDYFLTQEYFELNMGHFFTTVMHHNLFRHMNLEMKKYVNFFETILKIGALATVAVLVVFGGVWIYLYLQLAESASYINAFLLLIPFNILTENPYIKLYIRNQFDYKASNY